MSTGDSTLRNPFTLQRVGVFANFTCLYLFDDGEVVQPRAGNSAKHPARKRSLIHHRQKSAKTRSRPNAHWFAFLFVHAVATAVTPGAVVDALFTATLFFNQ